MKKMITKDVSDGEIPDYLFLIEQAIKAPSGHNTQPWLFHIVENGIEVCPDFTKALTEVDPVYRELLISVGCAVENLCIAALSRNYTPQVTIADDGIVTVLLQPGGKEAHLVEPFISLIADRRTNRGIYTGREIGESEISKLEEVSLETSVALHISKKEDASFEQITRLVLEGNVKQMQNERFKSELKAWMRYNKTHDRQTRDGLSYAVFGAPDLPRFLSSIIMGACLNPTIQNRGDKKKIASSSHFVLFTIANDTWNDLISLGRSLQRFLLKLTELGISYAFMNQPCELKDLSEKIRLYLKIDSAFPAVLLRLGYGNKVAPSLRKNIETFMVRE